MDKHFLTESDFKYIRHSNYYAIEKIEFEDFQIHSKRPEEYLSDIVFYNSEMEKSSEVFKDNSDDYVSNYYINVKTTCRSVDSKIKKTITMQADLNALTLRSLVKFCIESRNLDVINYISNRNFYFDEANQNMVQISSEYENNPIVQSTLKSIFTKMAAKQTLEKFKKRANFSCEVDNSLQTSCETLPEATDFKYNSETKQYCFEKTYYENDKRCKTAYALYNKNDHIVYEVNNYILDSSYNFVGGFKVDTDGSEISFKTIKVIDGEKYVIEREYEHKKLLFTFIGDEKSKMPE